MAYMARPVGKKTRCSWQLTMPFRPQVLQLLDILAEQPRQVHQARVLLVQPGADQVVVVNETVTLEDGLPGLQEGQQPGDIAGKF